MPEEGEPERGVIGNYYYHVPANLACHIRMADILAASSCFPGGFEPINFPSDFSLPRGELAGFEKRYKGLPVGLMDGGIVDNQGIEPVLLANDLMERNIRDSGKKLEGPALDLVIVCDVTSPYMEDYKASEQKETGWWRRFSPGWVLLFNSLVLIAAIALAIWSIRGGYPVVSFVCGALFAFSLSLFLFGRWLKGLPKRVGVSAAFMKPLGKLLRLKLFVYENLVMNRANSLLKLVNEAFLKHVRRLNYAKIFQNRRWKNRRIMAAIYELRKGEGGIEKKIKSGELGPHLKPSESIEEVALKASKMGTTLWYTEEELQRKGESKTNLLDAVIACGQFTMCWNLLEYMDKINKDPDNTGSQHAILITCKEQVKKDWAAFKIDPYWMTKLVLKADGSAEQ